MAYTVSIKKNFFYSSILTISGYLFPLLTFPYVTRVLGVTNIGICNFVDSIIQYFILFSMMGIGTTAIREIAKSKEDKRKLSLTFSSLLSLNMITTFIAIFILLVCTFVIPNMERHKELFFIGTAKILFNSLLIEWFYKGLEDFKYITARSLIIRSLYVLSVFLLVKSPDDYLIYFALNVVMVIINAIINLVHSRCFVKYSINGVRIKPYLASFITLGIYSLLTSMYTSFNVAYLGFTCGEIEVGYYSVASKLFSIILALFTAFTGVMLPRMSSLIAKGNVEQFKILTNKSVEALLAFVLPLIIITMSYAPTIVRIIAGNGYEESVLPMKIMMPLMFVIGYEQIIIIQVLMPLKKDKAILQNSFIGATIALLANIALVSTYKSVGSAIVWITSECAVMVSAQYFVKKYVGLQFPFGQISKRLFFAIPAFAICIYSYQDSLVRLFLTSLLVYTVYILYEYYIVKSTIIQEFSNVLMKLLKKK